jgi:hypothetical protein
MTRVEQNSIKARLSYMVNGKMGLDWRTGREFVVAGKGNEVEAIRDALRLITALEAVRSDVANGQCGDKK